MKKELPYRQIHLDFLKGLMTDSVRTGRPLQAVKPMARQASFAVKAAFI